MVIKKILPVIITLAALVLVIAGTGCTKKDNLTGDNWSGDSPQVAITDSFDLVYSYTHEGKVKGTETHIVCGSEDGIEAVGLLRFTGLTDSITVIEQPVLKLVATRRSDLSLGTVSLSFYKLNQNWAADSTDLVTDANLEPLGVPDLSVPDEVSSDGDTLEIEIPNTVIENWYTEDITGLNLAIRGTGDGWMEFKSAELSNGARLSFKYHLSGETDTLEYNQQPTFDSYRITGTQAEISDNSLILKNLLPERMYVHFPLPDTLFKDENGITLNETDRKRMTINKAELVLYTKETTYYDSTECYFFPYNVTMDTLAVPVVLTNDDLETIIYTYSSVKKKVEDPIKINITPIIQAFTSGDKSNNGVVIRNVYEIQNFGKLEFWNSNDAPEGKKPYIKIYYTAPYLKGD